MLLIIAVVLILYFEKLCCFARYRFLKPLMRRFNQPNRSTSSSAISQPAQSLPSKKPDEKKTSSNDTPEYLWIAGHREPISLFHLTPAVAATFMENASSKSCARQDTQRNYSQLCISVLFSIWLLQYSSVYTLENIFTSTFPVVTSVVFFSFAAFPSVVLEMINLVSF